MKCLIVAAVACVSLTATATAAPPAGGPAACRSRIDEIFSDDDDYTARDFCNDIIGGQSLDDLAFKKIPGNTPGDVREKCGGEDTVKSVCGGITGPTGTAAPPAGPAACRNRIDEIFSDDDDYTARDFCNDIIGGQSLDDLAFKKIPGNTPGDVREKCGGEDTVKSVCGGITGPTGTAAPPAVPAACRNRIDEIFSDDDDYTARDFCNDIIGGQSLDDLAFKKIPGNTPGDVREKCGGEDTVKSVCGGITGPTGTAAPPAVPAACRNRIDEIFSDDDDYTARDFCNDIIGGQSLDDLAFKKIPGNTPGDVREKCGGEDMVRSVCGGNDTTATATASR